MLKRFKGSHAAERQHHDVKGGVVVHDHGPDQNQKQQEHHQEGSPTLVGPAVIVSKTVEKNNGRRRLFGGRRPSSQTKLVELDPGADETEDDDDNHRIKAESSRQTDLHSKVIDDSDIVKPSLLSSKNEKLDQEGDYSISPIVADPQSATAESTPHSPFSSLPGPPSIEPVTDGPTKEAKATATATATATSANEGSPQRNSASSRLGPPKASSAAAVTSASTSPSVPPKPESVAALTPAAGDAAACLMSPPTRPPVRHSAEGIDPAAMSPSPPRRVASIASRGPLPFTSPKQEAVDERRVSPRTPRRVPFPYPRPPPTPRAGPKFSLESLARTQFPDFFADDDALNWDKAGGGGGGGVPDAELTEGSDEDSPATVQAECERYRTKEDEDVAVFINLVKRMSLKSLLHLLQGHVYSQKSHFSEEYLTQYTSALTQTSSDSMMGKGSGSWGSPYRSSGNNGKGGETQGGSKLRGILKAPTERHGTASQPTDDGGSGSPQRSPTRSEQGRPLTPPRHAAAGQPRKQFRWAEVTNQQVRTVKHVVERLGRDDDVAPDVWWTARELQAIRVDLLSTVRFFRRNRLEYAQSIEVLCRNSPDPRRPQTGQEAALMEDHMKRLMSDENSYARGLETHICRLLSDHRRAAVVAVLEEQAECRSFGDDASTTGHCLREQILAYSVMSTRFAHALGRCDHIDALKANLSKWKAEGEKWERSPDSE